MQKKCFNNSNNIFHGFMRSNDVKSPCVGILRDLICLADTSVGQNVGQGLLGMCNFLNSLARTNIKNTL